MPLKCLSYEKKVTRMAYKMSYNIFEEKSEVFKRQGLSKVQERQEIQSKIRQKVLKEKEEILEQQEPRFGLQVTKKLKNFFAGGILGKIYQWEKITSDQEILNIIRFGASLKFLDITPYNIHYEYGRSSKDRDTIQSKIQTLLQSCVITQSQGIIAIFQIYLMV